MLLHCAAKHLCGYLSNAPITKPQHFCVNCNGPLHGGTCGHLISEMPPPTIVIHRELLTQRGQEMMFAEKINASALICNYCIDPNVLLLHCVCYSPRLPRFQPSRNFITKVYQTLGKC